MKEIFFKCTLLTDIVLNSKLATEGNMTTMNYIPGSNFMGIVAGQLYKEDNLSEAFELFHSSEISYGDALLSKNNAISYQIPFSLFMEKGKEQPGTHNGYLHHLLSDENWPRTGMYKKQLKQIRNGYVSKDGIVLERIEKSFSLKSAYESSQRRSKEGAMFGFESILKVQEFIFSVQFKKADHIEKVRNALTGIKRIGKSKTAEYGQVLIEEQTGTVEKIETTSPSDYTLVYAQSNLCFLDEYGYPTFQPTAAQLGISGGNIDWSKSQVRTYAYSPWNGHRNSTDTERHCIAMGSVFYVSAKKEGGECVIGEHQAEGLGRVIYNPIFLAGDNSSAQTDFFKKEDVENKNTDPAKLPVSELGKFLLIKKDAKRKELNLSRDVQQAVEKSKPVFSNKITASQWGGIRALAVNETDMNQLYEKLFSDKIGLLTHGIADEKQWGKQRGKPRKEFEAIFLANKTNGSVFIAKYAAEMAKIAQKNTEVSHEN